MRAPLSSLAKTILDDPDATKALKDWLESGQPQATINMVTGDGGTERIKASRLNTTVATHPKDPGKPTKVHSANRLINGLAQLIGLLVNPLGR